MGRGKQRCWRAGLLVLAALVGGCRGVARPAADAEPLTASGTVRAREVRIASELGGRIVGVEVRVGAAVEAGDVLVLLDATSLLSGLAEAEAAVAAAQADLAVVEAGPRPAELAAARAALSLAEAARDGALAAWQNALDVLDAPQELDAQIVQARTQATLAAQGVQLAGAQLAREQLLRDQKAAGSLERRVADFQVQAAEAALAAAQADEKAAQAALNWLRLIRSQPLALAAQAHAAEGQYRVAEAGVGVAQARLDDLLAGPTLHEVAVAEASVRLAQAQADVLRAQRARLALTSPVDGVVLDQALHPGEVAAPATTILTVADLSQVTLVVYVPEGRIGQVRLGQAVLVTVDSLPGQALGGQVTRIGDAPEFTPRNVATKEERLNTFYAVEVRLFNPEGLLKPGMPADAVFQ